MEKIDYKKRAVDLKKVVSKNEIAEKENGETYINEKLCPFRGDAKHQVACTSQCKIHRADKKGFECIFSELVPISFNANKIRKYIKDYLGLKD